MATSKTDAKGPGSKASLEQIKDAHKSAPSAKATESNRNKVHRAITDKKDLKYIYPEDATDIASRKQFRTKVRREKKRLEKQLLQAKKGKLEDVTVEQAEKELNKFLKANINPEN